MNNDREMLEWAARAAGMHVLPVPWPDEDGWFFCEYHGRPALHFRKFGAAHQLGNPWMPTDDDGDALRLAVTTGMLFTYMQDRYEMFQRYFREELDDDRKPSEATRRAIVRAAAEIGKKMQ